MCTIPATQNVYYHNKLAFRQLITSGVAQETPTRWKFLVSRLAQDSGHVLGKGWSFSHHDWENGRNYAIVTYDNKDNQNPCDHSTDYSTG